MIVIPIQNQHSYQSIPRNKDLKLTIDNHCNSPSRVLVVDWKGDCFVCSCEAWLPISIGKIERFVDLADIWQSSTAKSLQQDIDQGKFTHCAVNRCGVIDDAISLDHYLVSINIDESCNIACPSCRKDHVMITAGEIYENKLERVNHLVDLLEKFDAPCHVVMSGNGDPLASAIMRPLIHRYRPRQNHTIRLFTNGLLLEKQLSESTILPHVTQYFISIDAGSADVYEKVRLGGSWPVLLKNLAWLKANVKNNPSEVLLKLVLQKDNYKDLDNFCQLVIDHGFQGVINYLEDWGTWEDFALHDVIGNVQHAQHQQALDHLKSCYQKFSNRIQFNSKLRSMANV